MDKAKILEFLDKVTDGIKSVAPIASAFGIPFVEKVASLADTAVDIGKNALERAEDAKVIFTNGEKDQIEARIKSLAEVNDELAAIIANS